MSRRGWLLFTGRPHGVGRLRKPNGTEYEGEWHLGEMTGHGVLMQVRVALLHCVAVARVGAWLMMQVMHTFGRPMELEWMASLCAACHQAKEWSERWRAIHTLERLRLACGMEMAR